MLVRVLFRRPIYFANNCRAEIVKFTGRTHVIYARKSPRVLVIYTRSANRASSIAKYHGSPSFELKREIAHRLAGGCETEENVVRIMRVHV